MTGLAAVLLDPTLILGCLSFVFICWFLFREDRSRLPPGPKPWPIIGNIPQLRSSGKFTYEIFNELRAQYGDIVRVRAGPVQNMVIMFGYKNYHKAAVLMDKTKYRPTGLRVINKIFGNKGVFLGNGDEHAYLRKFSLGAFREFGVGRRAIEERIQEEADILCDFISAKDGQPFDYFFTFKKVASNVIGNIIYGHRYDYDDPEFLKAIDCIDTFFKTLSPFSWENFIPFSENLPISKVPRIMEAFDYLNSYAKAKIAEHRRTFDANNIRDFVDIFIQHETDHDEYLTVENMFRLIVDFYNAGTDTTSLSMYWAILFLIKHPDAQQKCRQQINEVVGDGLLSVSHREELPYLRAVIAEVLRMACVAPQTAPHSVREDMEFEGKIIPKDSTIFFSTFSLLQDPEVWKNPTEFRPERFLTDDGKYGKEPEHFTPFGMGSRVCLGQHLARTELFIFLGTMIQHFDFRSPVNPGKLSTRRIQSGITSQPETYQVCAVPIRD